MIQLGWDISLNEPKPDQVAIVIATYDDLREKISVAHQYVVRLLENPRVSVSRVDPDRPYGFGFIGDPDSVEEHPRGYAGNVYITPIDDNNDFRPLVTAISIPYSHWQEFIRLTPEKTRPWTKLKLSWDLSRYKPAFLHEEQVGSRWYKVHVMFRGNLDECIEYMITHDENGISLKDNMDEAMQENEDEVQGVISDWHYFGRRTEVDMLKNAIVVDYTENSNHLYWMYEDEVSQVVSDWKRQKEEEDDTP